MIYTDDSEFSCGMCHRQGSDLKILKCGCTFHGKCTPNDFFRRDNLGGTQNDTIKCPVCSSVSKSKVYLMPLAFNDLEKSVLLRTKKAAASAGGKRDRETTAETSQIAAMQAEVDVYSRLIFQPSKCGALDMLRTGRWKDDEIALTDYLVGAFDKGNLPLPNGTKLNQFLGDFLLCKPSRLTKKMKNAKLSMRSYERNSSPRLSPQGPHNDTKLLSTLEETFLASLPSRAERLELRFNFTKQWRTHISNLFLQGGNASLLQADDWISSLEELERRARAAEGNLKHLQRRCQVGALSNKKPRTTMSTFRGDDSTPKSSETSAQDYKASTAGVATKRDIFDDDSSECSDELNHISLEGLMGPDTAEPAPQRLPMSNAVLVEHECSSPATDSSDDDDAITDGHSGCDFLRQYTATRPSSFLEVIALYLQQNKMPFHHADCWAPVEQPNTLGSGEGLVDNGNGTEIRLMHAGSTTRTDTPREMLKSMEAFGDFNSNVTFELGRGLPGRTYESGKPQWEYDLGCAKSWSDLQVEGAIANGIKSAAAIPIDCAGVGRIVVALYSSNNIQKDVSLLYHMKSYLSGFAPRPAWNLVIDINVPTQATDEEFSSPFDDKISKALGDEDPVGPLGSRTAQIPFPWNPMTPLVESQVADAATRRLSENPLDLLKPDETSSSNVVDDEGSTQAEIIELMERQLNDNETRRASSSSSAAFVLHDDDEETRRIRALLYFLGMPVSLRSKSDKDIIETLESSYRAYCCSKRHARADLVRLLVTEWMCLDSSTASMMALTMMGVPAPPVCSLPPSSSLSQAPIIVVPSSDSGRRQSGSSATGLAKPPPMAHSCDLFLMAGPRGSSARLDTTLSSNSATGGRPFPDLRY